MKPEKMPFDVESVKAKIKTIGSSKRAYIKKHWPIAIVVVLITGSAVWFAWYAQDARVLMFLVMILLATFGILHDYAHRKFMEQVAHALGCTYRKDGGLGSVSGQLFSIGHSRRITNVISGTQQGLPIRIFNYMTTIGGGKHKKTLAYTVFETTYPHELPDIILTSTNSFWVGSQAVPNIANRTTLSFEGDFSKKFRVSVRKEFEIEAYQIFTPVVMHHLLETYTDLNFELHNNTFYIFQHTFLGTTESLLTLYATGCDLGTLFVPHFREVSADVEALESAISKR